MLTYHDHRRAGPTRRLVEVASRCTIGQPAALAAWVTEVRVTGRQGEYHASWGGTCTAARLLEAALDGVPGNVRRDAHSSSVVPTPAGGERAQAPLHACFPKSGPKSGYVTPNPTHVVTCALLGRVTARDSCCHGYNREDQLVFEPLGWYDTSPHAGPRPWSIAPERLRKIASKQLKIASKQLNAFLTRTCARVRSSPPVLSAGRYGCLAWQLRTSPPT